MKRLKNWCHRQLTNINFLSCTRKVFWKLIHAYTIANIWEGVEKLSTLSTTKALTKWLNSFWIPFWASRKLFRTFSYKGCKRSILEPLIGDDDDKNKDIPKNFRNKNTIGFIFEFFSNNNFVGAGQKVYFILAFALNAPRNTRRNFSELRNSKANKKIRWKKSIKEEEIE